METQWGEGPCSQSTRVTGRSKEGWRVYKQKDVHR